MYGFLQKESKYTTQLENDVNSPAIPLMFKDMIDVHIKLNVLLSIYKYEIFNPFQAFIVNWSWEIK